MRPPAQFAPNPCARSDSRLTMPGRSAPIAVTTSAVFGAWPSSVSATVGRIIGARVAKRSSCACAGNSPCSAAWRTTCCQQRKAHRGQRTLPQFARGLAFPDETPVLRRNRPRIPAVGKMVDAAASDRIAGKDRPFDRSDAPVPRQQRRVIADAAEPRAGERFVADARVRMRGDDELGAFGNRVAGHDARILEDVQRDASPPWPPAPADRPPPASRRAGRRRRHHAAPRIPKRRNTGIRRRCTSWGRPAVVERCPPRRLAPKRPHAPRGEAKNTPESAV